jgi:hypothetical protein
MLDGEAIPGARTKVAEGREADHAGLVLSDQHRVSGCHSPLPPGAAFVERRGLINVHRG